MEVDGILGGAGSLTGRTPLTRPAEFETGEDGEPILPPPAKAIPPHCQRILNSPRYETCLTAGGCVGMQPDGRCVAEIVETCRRAGIDWNFQVGIDGHGNQIWEYAGEPLPPREDLA